MAKKSPKGFKKFEDSKKDKKSDAKSKLKEGSKKEMAKDRKGK